MVALYDANTKRLVEECEYKNDYIKEQGVNVSITFKFFDTSNSLKCAFVINRTAKSYFSVKEIEALRIIRSHLINLHTNFFVSFSDSTVEKKRANSKCVLTKRESEIADLLCNGLSPSQISAKNYLSLKTVYNHLANIYQKYQVSSQRELLAAILNPSD